MFELEYWFWNKIFTVCWTYHWNVEKNEPDNLNFLLLILLYKICIFTNFTLSKRIVYNRIYI